MKIVFSIYPNPTSDLITVRVRSQNKVDASIYNTLGVQILSTLELTKSAGEERTGQFDLSSHPAGVYLIQIQDGQQVYSKRIIRK
ncbi:MAG: T9SS type A sorting domain-containing protein [Flammeovirgaceae bacterium]|nr:T9SS type A sorting domain-containing protein [Flammeovirgaceae bacterium]